MSDKYVLICMPIHRHPELKSVECLLETIRYSKCRIAYHWQSGDALLSRARNKVGESFLKEKEFDYLMWIDDDITWNSQDGIIDLLISRKKDIIGGAYPEKSDCSTPTIRTLYIQKLIDIKKYKNQKIKVPKNKLFEVEYVGTGFMLISRQCIENVYVKFPFPFQPIFPKGEYLDEGWSFCHRAKSLGYKIWADTTFELGRSGTTTYKLKKSSYE